MPGAARPKTTYAALAPWRSDQQIGSPVAVDVAGRCDGEAGLVAGRSAVDAVAGGPEASEIDRSGAFASEHDVSGIGIGRTDGDVRETVAVHVAGGGDRRARVIRRRRADEDEPCPVRRDATEIGRPASAEDHVGRARLRERRRVRARRADQDVGPAVAVHVARVGDRRPGPRVDGGTDEARRRRFEQVDRPRRRRPAAAGQQ